MTYRSLAPSGFPFSMNCATPVTRMPIRSSTVIYILITINHTSTSSSSNSERNYIGLAYSKILHNTNHTVVLMQVVLRSLPAMRAKPFTTPPAYLVTSPTTTPPNA